MSSYRFYGFFFNADNEEIALTKNEFCSRFSCRPSQLLDPFSCLFFNDFYEFDHGRVYGRYDHRLYGGWYYIDKPIKLLSHK